MTTYYAFAGDGWYPLGGFQDFVGRFPDMETAKAAAESKGAPDWAHVAAVSESGFQVVAWFDHRGWHSDPEDAGWFGVVSA